MIVENNILLNSKFVKPVAEGNWRGEKIVITEHDARLSKVFDFELLNTYLI